MNTPSIGRSEELYVRNPEVIVEWCDGRLCVVQARTGKRFAVPAKVIALLDDLTRPSSVPGGLCIS